VPRPPEEPVYSVTAARRGTSDDLGQRQKRYLISMGIRTICFVLAVVTHGPIRWVFVAAAVVLPYVAVVMANAVGSGAGAAPTAYVPQQAALGSAERTILNDSGAAHRPTPDGEPVTKP
jgi:DUF3099 family protein